MKRKLFILAIIIMIPFVGSSQEKQKSVKIVGTGAVKMLAKKQALTERYKTINRSDLSPKELDKRLRAIEEYLGIK